MAAWWTEPAGPCRVQPRPGRLPSPGGSGQGCPEIWVGPPCIGPHQVESHRSDEAHTLAGPQSHTCSRETAHLPAGSLDPLGAGSCVSDGRDWKAQHPAGRWGEEGTAGAWPRLRPPRTSLGWGLLQGPAGGTGRRAQSPRGKTNPEGDEGVGHSPGPGAPGRVQGVFSARPQGSCCVRGCGAGVLPAAGSTRGCAVPGGGPSSGPGRHGEQVLLHWGQLLVSEHQMDGAAEPGLVQGGRGCGSGRVPAPQGCPGHLRVSRSESASRMLWLCP